MKFVRMSKIRFLTNFMDITYLGHSAFRIKGKAATVITDPFDPQMVGIKFPKVSGDIVTVSHNHNDHNYLSGVVDTKRVIEGPGEYEIGGVSIVGYKTFHDAKNGEERGKNTVYVYEMEDLRLCHLGDLGHELSNTLIEEIGNIDILMIPVGGFYTINAEVASKVSQAIEASIVLPMHYKTEDMADSLKEKLSSVDDFLKQTGLSVEKTDKLSVKKSDISPEGQKIVLLERKQI